MGWLTSLFKKIDVGKAVDTVFSGIDKSILTKEELVDYESKKADMLTKFVLNDNNITRGISRRVIAFMFSIVFLALIVLGVGVWTVNEEYSEFIFTVIKELLLTPVSMILAFYFTLYGIDKFKGFRKKKE